MQALLASNQNDAVWVSPDNGDPRRSRDGVLFSPGPSSVGMAVEPARLSFLQLAQAMESIKKRRSAAGLTRFAQERNWLRQHHKSYAGKWVALEGNELLAVGETAREVFAQVRGRSEPALVVQIEDEEQPFAGW